MNIFKVIAFLSAFSITAIYPDFTLPNVLEDNGCSSGYGLLMYQTELLSPEFITQEFLIFYAHGGGLNKCGCHYNRKTNECHCHRNRGCGCECEPSSCN